MARHHSEWSVEIRPQKGWLNVNLKELWQYRDLIYLLARRTFVAMYKQTILGPAWAIIQPLLTTSIFTVVFGKIAQISTDGMPQFLFYMCGSVPWNYFARCLEKTSQTFLENEKVFGKVYFPRLTTPISNVLASIIQFGVQMILVLIFLAYYLAKGAISPNWWAWLLIPVALVHLGVMGLGFGVIISSLTTKYRDLAILVNFGVQLWMYATPIVYPLSQLGDGLMKTILLINPVTAPVEVFRYAVLGRGTIVPAYLALSWVITALVALVGVMLFNHVEKTFMDTV